MDEREHLPVDEPQIEATIVGALLLVLGTPILNYALSAFLLVPKEHAGGAQQHALDTMLTYPNSLAHYTILFCPTLVAWLTTTTALLLRSRRIWRVGLILSPPLFLVTIAYGIFI